MADKTALRISPPKIPVAVEAKLTELKNSPALSDEDFAHLWSDLRDPQKFQQANDFLDSNNVSDQERQAFMTWANKQPKPAWNADRPDSNMMQIGGVGIAPEDALLGANIGRAAIAKGPSMAMRAGNVMKETVSTAAPILKYEAVRHGLQTVGVPAPLATVLAVAASGHGGKGRRAAAEPLLVEAPKSAPAMDMSLLNPARPSGGSVAAPSAMVEPTLAQPAEVPLAEPTAAVDPELEDQLGREDLVRQLLSMDSFANMGTGTRKR